MAPTDAKRQQLNQLFSLNRKVTKAYLLKESLDRLWNISTRARCCVTCRVGCYSFDDSMPAFEELANMLGDHLDGILNYCRVKVRFGVVEAINGNIKTLVQRGRGYKNLRYLLL